MNYEIKLDDKMSAPAKAAAGALAQLEKQIKSEQESLRKLEQQFKQMNSASVVDIATAKKMRESIQQRKDSIGDLTTQLVNAGGAAPKMSSGLRSVEDALKGASGAGALALGTVAAVVVAITAVATIAVGAAIAVGKLAKEFSALAISASEARASVESSLEVMYGSQQGAQSTYKAIVEVTNRVAISQQRALEISDNLVKSGEMNGHRMIKSIEAIGKAEAARAGAGKVLEDVISASNKTASSRFHGGVFTMTRAQMRDVGLSYRDMSKEIAKQLGTGLNEAHARLATGMVPLKAGLAALHNVVNDKLGDIAARKLLSVTHQSQRLKDNVRSMFATFDTGPFGRALKTIADLFDENIAQGASLRSTLKTAFDEIGKAVEAVSPYVEIFFLGLQVMANKVLIALFPLRKVFRDLGIGSADSLSSFENAMLSMGEVAAGVFGAMAKFAAYVIRNWDTLIDKAKTVASVFEAMTFGDEIAKGVGTAIGERIKKSRAEDEARDSGIRIAQGLANGIDKESVAAEAAADRLAKRVQERFDRAMGIHSPSTVMRERGRNMGAGLALGEEDSIPTVAASARKMGNASAGAVMPSVAPRATGGTPRIEVNFHSGAITLEGNADSLSALQEKLTELMADVFQQAALAQGAG